MEQDRNINYGIFSPKIENSHNFKLNKRKNNFGNYSNYTKYNYSINSPINLYSHPKNSSKTLFSPNYSKVSTLLSPIHRINMKIGKNKSKRNINSRPISSTSRGLPSVKNKSFINSPLYKNNNSLKIMFTNLNENFKTNQKFFNLETEKLYQETHQIKKLVKTLSKELSVLKLENAEKDQLINMKEKQINGIIINNKNMQTFENAKNNTNSNEPNSSIILDNSNNINQNGNDSIIYNDSIYINSLLRNKNSATGNLYFKIKKEIKKTNIEIKKEDEKFEKLKHSIFNTKVNELNIESKLLDEQITKINSLIANALLVKEKNLVKLNNIEDLQESIFRQKSILKNLKSMIESLTKEESELTITLDKNKNEFNSKLKKVNKNLSNLVLLKKRNENLSNKNGNPINNTIDRSEINPKTISSLSLLYKRKINELKKSIKFYQKQFQFSETEINKLKEKRKKLFETGKIKSIKFDANFFDNNNQYNNLKLNIKRDNQMPVGKIKPPKIPDEEIISRLKVKLNEMKKGEKELEDKILLYQNKLNEIDVHQEEEKEEINESQIEFGIDNENPYYIEDEDNVPETTCKFTSSQFNQFTYILFKNFESKGIVQEESTNKLINPLIDFVNKNNLLSIEYPSINFDMIVEEFTNIILNVLNLNNENNHVLTKIFIGALFYNSGCKINKFIEYFNVLFSYTKNYKIDESKMKNKLKEKYKEQATKLVSYINNYVSDELVSSPYLSLLKVKQLLDKNEVKLKDKYIEFIFYYMKKFDDPQSKLSDLKYSLLKDIIPLSSNGKENLDNNSNLNFNENDIIDNNESIKEETKIDLNKKKESNILDEIDKKSIENNLDNNNNGISGIKKSPTEEDFSNRQKKKNHTDKNDKGDNSDDFMDEDEDSMTEITNEEYVKQLTEAISIMQNGLKEKNISFNDLMANVIQKRKITGVFYECITIEDFNDQLKSIGIVLSDLKLSCLCSKYSIPNELRLIDKNKIEKDIEKQSKGKLSFEEDDDDN